MHRKSWNRRGAVAAALTVTLAGIVVASQIGATAATPDAAKEKEGRATAEAVGGVTAAAGSLAYTHNWGYRSGWWQLRLSGLPVTAGQAVTVSASECGSVGAEWIGAARTSVYNVAVENGAVSTRVYVDSSSLYGLCLHYVG